jgi:2-oxoglutarate dehydrogenase E1 component
MDNRAKMIETGEGIDWAMARRWPSARWSRKAPRSACPARMCERGTFSQRHSVLYDQETEERYIPLANVAPNQAPLRSDQLDAVGRGGARLRIRLLAGASRTR